MLSLEWIPRETRGYDVGIDYSCWQGYQFAFRSQILIHCKMMVIPFTKRKIASPLKEKPKEEELDSMHVWAA